MFDLARIPSRVVEIALGAAIAVSVVVGAYQAGKISERRWWRAELAARSAVVKATMARLGEDAVTLDAALLRDIEDFNGRLRDAEVALARTRLQNVDDGNGACRPVPAHCLQP